MSDTTALRLLPRIQRFRTPIGAVTLDIRDLSAAAERAGVEIRHSPMERLAERLAALPSGVREQVFAELAAGRPAQVTDGTTTTVFALVSFPAAGALVAASGRDVREMRAGSSCAGFLPGARSLARCGGGR